MISPDPHLWPAFGANSEKGPTLLQNRSLKSPDSTWKSFFTLFTTYFSTKYLEQNCVVQALNFLPLTAHLRLPECWICPKTTCCQLNHWPICVLKGLLGLLGWAGNTQSRHFLLFYTHMYPKVPKSTLKYQKVPKLGLLGCITLAAISSTIAPYHYCHYWRRHWRQQKVRLRLCALIGYGT